MLECFLRAFRISQRGRILPVLAQQVVKYAIFISIYDKLRPRRSIGHTLCRYFLNDLIRLLHWDAPAAASDPVEGCIPTYPLAHKAGPIEIWAIFSPLAGELLIFGGSSEPQGALTGMKWHCSSTWGGYGSVVRPHEPRGLGCRLSAVCGPFRSSQGLSAPLE